MLLFETTSPQDDFVFVNTKKSLKSQMYHMISIAWLQEDEKMQRERNTNADPEITSYTHRGTKISNKPSN